MNTRIHEGQDTPSFGYTNVIYALHALAGFIGITSAASVIGSFVFGVPSILAVIMNYARNDAVRGTWLESHFRWQIRTFWGAVIIGLALFVVAVLLGVLGIVSLASSVVTGPAGVAGAAGAAVGAWVALTFGATIAGIWILYRVIRGWMALRAGKPMYV